MKGPFHKLYRIKARLTSIQDDPVRIANGYALGIFLATTPFIGLKVFIALLIASVFHWNKVAAVIGVYHVNTLTAPLFYGLSFKIGSMVVGSEQSFRIPQRLSFHSIFHAFAGSTEILIILLVGGLILGIPGAYLAKKLVNNIIFKK